MIKTDAIKSAIAVALIFLAGGAWLYLDCLNRTEQGITQQANNELVQARTEGKRRTEAKTSFENHIIGNMHNCQAAAEKAKIDYVALMQKAMPGKKNAPLAIPLAITDEAETLMASTKAECQQIYETRLKSGQ
jgi:hypothetical protein